MQNINKEKIVPYSTANMYSLVADIEKYSDFLPYCTGSEILVSENNVVKAYIDVSYLGLKNRLTTVNVIVPDATITMTLASGPFESLQGIWSFKDINDANSKVSLTLEFKAIAMLPVVLVEKAASQVMEAFIKRAGEIYG